MPRCRRNDPKLKPQGKPQTTPDINRVQFETRRFQFRSSPPWATLEGWYYGFQTGRGLTRREAVRVDATQPAHRIASRRLDLDHIGAQIGKDLTGIGAGQILAEIQYADALQQRLRHTEPLPNLSNPGALSMISSRIASAVSRSLAKPSLNRLT